MSDARQPYLIVGVFGLAVIVWFSMMIGIAVARHPHGPHRNVSAAVEANLNHIGTALYTYANEHSSRFPPRLSMLYPDYISDPAVFWHSGDTDPRPLTIDNDEPNGINSAQVSFQYFGEGREAGEPPFVLVQDNSLSNNAGAGAYALLSDGGVSFLVPDTAGLPLTAIARSHLEQIDAALHSYADAHEGQFPPVFSALYPEFISDPTVFWNPGDDLPRAAPPPTTIDNDQPNAANSAQISFAYLGAGLTTDSDPGAILVQDNSPSNNGGAIVNMLTLGAGVDAYVPEVTCKSKESCRIIAEQNLKHLARILYMYATENREMFPDTLSMLYRSRIYDPTTFWHPGDNDPRPLTIDNDVPNQPNSTQISYAYFRGSTDFDMLAVVVQDNSLANNDGEGLLVVTAEGVVDFFEASDRTHPSIEASQENLRQIGLALEEYADSHGGQFPTELSLLFPDYISDPTVFWNPGDRDPAPTTIDNDMPNVPNSAQVSYHYLGAAYTSSSPSGTVLVADNSLANNFGSGVNVLTADGRADFYVPEVPHCTSPQSCISIARARLRTMGIALQIHATNNGGVLPPTLSTLYPQWIARPSDFWHPRDNDPWPLTIDNDVPNALNSAQISFDYLAALQNLWELQPDDVLIRDNTPANSGGNAMLELRADGGVYEVPVGSLRGRGPKK